VAEDRDLADAEVVEHGRGVGGQQLEAVVDVRLRRPAPADLVGRDDPVAGVRQHLDDVVEVVAAEGLAVHQHDGLPVRLPARRDVHVRHRHRLQVAGELQGSDGIGVLVALEADAQGRE